MARARSKATPIAKANEKAVKLWSTCGQFYFGLQYGKSGYYATGKANFSKESFITFASGYEAEGFAGAFAQQIFSVWKENSKKPAPEEKEELQKNEFNVLECGAGTGDLCFNTLSKISEMATVSPEWAKLWGEITYHIVEISFSLIEHQKKTTLQFKEKVQIHQGDATKLATFIPKQKMGVVFSNELLDMFKTHEVFVDPTSTNLVGLCVPIIDANAGAPYIEKAGLKLKALKHKAVEYLQILQVFDKHDAAYSRGLKSYGDVFSAGYSTLILSDEDFWKIHSVYASEEKPAPIFVISHVKVDIQLFPQLAEFFKKNKHYGVSKATVFPSLDIASYMQNVKAVLAPRGNAITVDYGETFTDMPKNGSYKTFGSANGNGNTKSGNNPDVAPGFLDITANAVDFSNAADSGAEAGLSVLHYGDLSQMLPPEAEIRKVLDPRKTEIYDRSAHNFKFLVQTNGVTASSPDRFFGKSKKVLSADVLKEQEALANELPSLETMLRALMGRG